MSHDYDHCFGECSKGTLLSSIPPFWSSSSSSLYAGPANSCLDESSQKTQRLSAQTGLSLGVDCLLNEFRQRRSRLRRPNRAASDGASVDDWTRGGSSSEPTPLRPFVEEGPCRTDRSEEWTGEIGTEPICPRALDLTLGGQKTSRWESLPSDNLGLGGTGLTQKPFASEHAWLTGLRSSRAVDLLKEKRASNSTNERLSLPRQEAFAMPRLVRPAGSGLSHRPSDEAAEDPKPVGLEGDEHKQTLPETEILSGGESESIFYSSFDSHPQTHI
ncbi:unnamed protein product [Protopolystoma xenopodis]|uniref:Uncharacterized protein n=1 Tax=Protopolystoma xenopodis TaxID=117903 RepID=A0A3S4ZZ14_9PLAT|nr:unnamed protein product [Protopolystoma xenopodis]